MLKSKVLFLSFLVSMTLLPYVVSFITLNVNQLNRVEILALLFWYSVCLTVPLLLKDFSTSLLVWAYHLVLVGIPVGSDLVCWMTGVTPRMWWIDMKHLMPVAWYMQGVLTRQYYSFISSLVLILLPGFVCFGVVCTLKWFKDPLMNRLKPRLYKSLSRTRYS